MSDTEKTETGLAALYKALPGGVQMALAGMLVFVAFYAMIHLMIAMPSISKRAGNLPASEQCWELREISRKIYKLNKCTGDTAEFTSPAKAGATNNSAPASAPTVDFKPDAKK